MSTPDDPRSAEPEHPAQPEHATPPEHAAQPEHPAQPEQPAPSGTGTTPEPPTAPQPQPQPSAAADTQVIRPAQAAHEQQPSGQPAQGHPTQGQPTQGQPTQGQPPYGQSPYGQQAPRSAHPTNPFLPPHPAAPPESRTGGQGQGAPHGQAQPGQGQQGQQGHPAQGYPGSGAPGVVPPGQQPPGGGGPTGGEGDGRPRRSLWGPLVVVAVVAALCAAIVTAGLMTLFQNNDDDGGSASLATLGQGASQSAPVTGSSVDNPDWEKVAAAVQSSVVAIEVQTDSGGAQGSGVIIDRSGNIITNNHVVAGATTGGLQVTLTDGRLFEAEIVGTDPTTDLAVIKITDAPSDLSPATLGDSSAVRVGEAVMAVGNPLGLSNTVTTGIVSAVDRPVSTSESGTEAVVTNAIQIDAAINPGNSGGPLFDGQGEVIGITSSIATLSSESGSIGLGFAIPVNLAKQIGSQLIDNGSAEHAFLGVSMTDGTATADGVTRRGAVVEQVSADSPAAAAGLQPKDVIVAIDDNPVGGAESLTAYVRELTAGSKVTLTIVRDGQTKKVDVTLATRQETATSAPSAPSDSGSSQPQTPGQGQNGSDQLTPEQLWEWFQQQQQQQGQG